MQKLGKTGCFQAWDGYFVEDIPVNVRVQQYKKKVNQLSVYIRVNKITLITNSLNSMKIFIAFFSVVTIQFNYVVEPFGRL